MTPLLDIRNLKVDFNREGITTTAVRNISFSLHSGKITAIVGESGSGKSITALSLLNLLPANAILGGEIMYTRNGTEPVNILSMPAKDLMNTRGKEIAMIFQEPMTSLNPVLTCGEQIIETLRRHLDISKKEALSKTIELFTEVELPQPAGIVNRYPHQLSGGQKQRVMIAMAMCCQPALLIADEPTTALDVRTQKSIVDLIKKLQQKNGMSVLFISHDLGLVADIADELLVMYQGNIVEQGPASTVLNKPVHPYTKALLACRPAVNSKGNKLPVLEDFIAGDATTPKPLPIQQVPVAGSETVLSVQDLSVHFKHRKQFFGTQPAITMAVDKVSFDVKQHEIVGIVGESGSGKTTLGRAILQLVKPSAGKIILNGTDLNKLSPGELRKIRKNIQIVFQDPFGSLNPRLSIGEAIMEPLEVHRLYTGQKERKEKAISLLQQVQLPSDVFNRYPHQFSGGQRQRICIARALASDPRFLIFDESVSALDVSVQAHVINLINDLRQSGHFTAIFISHDLSVVHYLCDRILVMKQGKIIESGTSDEVYHHPKEGYTRELIAAIAGKKMQGVQ
ncbi:MAG TPA: ABC transporter ATP-binding protein [Ferruginibacter sp.]|nr:ABC transporter ATP-binding protein [Ferruginibacter sp.]